MRVALASLVDPGQQGGHLEEKVASVSLPGAPEFEVAAGRPLGAVLVTKGVVASGVDQGSEPVIVIHPKENPPRGSVWRELSREWRTAARGVCPQGENGGDRVTHTLERGHSE